MRHFAFTYFLSFFILRSSNQAPHILARDTIRVPENHRAVNEPYQCSSHSFEGHIQFLI